MVFYLLHRDAPIMLMFIPPMVVLYFVGIGVSAIVVGRRKKRQAAEAAAT